MLFARFLKIAIETHNQYKVDYLYGFFLMCVHVIIMPALWFLLTNGGERSLGGWELSGLVVIPVFYGLIVGFLSSIGVYGAFYELSSEDGRKRITQYFTKPVHPLIFIYGLNVSPVGVLRFIGTAVVLLFFIQYFGLHLSAQFFALLAFGAVILLNLSSYPILLFIAFENSSKPLHRLIWAFLDFTELPIDRLKGIAGVVTSVIIPIAFISAVPAQALAFDPPFRTIALSAAMAALTTIGSLVLWKVAKRRFEATGE